MSIIEDSTIFLYEFLKVCLYLINTYKLPTNPVTTILLTGMAFYGYTKLKPRVNFDVKRWSNRLLVLVYSIALLGFINFILENVWLTAFYLKYTYFNVGKVWLSSIYFENPYVWIVNLIRNNVFIIVIFFVSHDIFKHVNFNKKTLIGFFSVSLYIFMFFFISSNYGHIDWTYSLINGFPPSTVISAFLLSVLGKPQLFYTFYTIWQPKR